MKKYFSKTIIIILSIVVVCTTLMLYLFRNDIRQCHQQRQAKQFLLDNISGHGWIESYLTDSRTGDTLHFSPYDYENLYRAKDTLDSLRRIYRPIRTVYRDADILTDDSLSSIVRQAFGVWQTSPYARHVDFDNFCEYLLPYRVGKEPLDFAFPDSIRKRYAYIYDSIPNDPIAAASMINNDMKRWMVFELKSHALLSEPSMSELMDEGMGSCRALAVLFVQTMRSLGIPAAIDECPIWGHRSSGHEWTAVMDTTGKWRFFEPAEFNPDGFRAVGGGTRTPKIFRRTYSFNHSFYPPVERRDMPPLFTTFNRKDVTREYTSVSDVTVTPDRNIDKSNGILYLTVFNSEKWQPVAWAEIDEDGSARFTDMGNNNIMYLPVFYRNGVTIPAGAPFVLSEEAKTRRIIPQKELTQSLDMEFANLYWVFMGYDTFVPSSTRRLELLYWDDEWIFADSCMVGPSPEKISHFDNVPVGGLYLIKGKTWANTWQRPFMADSVSKGSVWY